MEAHWDPTHASKVEGVNATISAWNAEECNRVLGQELTEAEEEEEKEEEQGEKLHAGLASAATERELKSWEK